MFIKIPLQFLKQNFKFKYLNHIFRLQYYSSEFHIFFNYKKHIYYRQ